MLAAAVGGRGELQRATQNLPIDAVGEESVDRLRSAAAYGDLAGALGAVLGERYVYAGHSTAIRYHSVVQAYLAGDWDDALVRIREIETRARTEDAPQAAVLARALAAEIHCFRGELGQAREWLALIPEHITHPLVARARLGVRYWSGQEEEAVEQAWHDVRDALKCGLFTGVERVLLRIIMFTVGAEPARLQEAVRALEQLELLYEEAPTSMAYEALLIGRGLLHHDAHSAALAYRSAKSRADKAMLVSCCHCLAEVVDDPAPWLVEATRRMHQLSIGRPVRTMLGRLAQRRNVPLPRPRSARERLSESDVRLIEMVSDGATNRQLAARLACSEKTVEQRLTRLFQRTGSRSRVELAAAWLDGTVAALGLLPDGPSSGTP